MLIRPGPSSIDAGEYPGGVVIHVYGVPSLRLLHTSKARTGAEAALNAGADADAALAALPPDTALCLVGYDGDTGRRYRQGEWL